MKLKIKILLLCFFCISLGIVTTYCTLTKKYNKIIELLTHDMQKEMNVMHEIHKINRKIKSVELKYKNCPKELESTKKFPRVLLYVNDKNISQLERVFREIIVLTYVTSSNGTNNRDCRFHAGDQIINGVHYAPEFVKQWAHTLEDNYEIDAIGKALRSDFTLLLNQINALQEKHK